MTSWRFVPLAMLAIYAAVMSGIIVRYRRRYGRSPIRLSGSGGAMDRIRETALILFGVLLVWQAVAAAFGLYIPLGNRLFRSEEHTSELQSLRHLVCRLLLE